MSILEAEYVAVSQGVREGIWICRFVNEFLPESVVRKIKILDDNKTSLTLIRDLESQNYTKYINVIHQHVRELIKNRKLVIEWISNSNMLADGLIKAFFVRPFKKHCEEWGLIKRKG